jgi:LacI family transcriptional regulator
MPSKKSRSPSKKPTIQDVARHVGVSHSTVSRVLNYDSATIPISEETRQRIMEAVRELGYQPNMTARSLKTQRTQMIAVMIGDISNAFYHPIVRQIQDVAGTHNYDVLISNSDHIYEHEKRFLDTILRRPVDGIIMAPHCLKFEEIDQFIERSHIPMVALGAQVNHPLVDVVGGTSEPATYDAVKWLIEEKGHQHIGFISTLDNMPPGPSRLHGYQRAMEEHGLIVRPEYVQHAEFTIEGGRRAMHTFLSQPKPPTVVFAANSLMAIGAMIVARQQGYDVPGDIGVMGFDDIPEAMMVTPQLTTVIRDLPRIGRQLADILFARILGQENGPGRFFQSEWKLMIRESV